ncbi:hypothetical protein GCM10011506_35200 [Marivirga lumbricoides]|uniref:Uncharacterized protein n=1 Tax=Marivirga lumbricoides TaxID=1046115 RepID=A0ABQ1MXJ0_9BACT|nr:hypothetical protein GCM10011506_35200 [Marivirga lumbricoides]
MKNGTAMSPTRKADITCHSHSLKAINIGTKKMRTGNITSIILAFFFLIFNCLKSDITL